MLTSRFCLSVFDPVVNTGLLDVVRASRRVVVSQASSWSAWVSDRAVSSSETSASSVADAWTLTRTPKATTTTIANASAAPSRPA